MKLGSLVVVCLGLALPVVGHAQFKAYGEFTAADFSAFGNTAVLYGGTGGVDFGLAKVKRLDVGFDLRTSFVRGEYSLNQASIGPTIGYTRKRYTAYGEFLIGFARFNTGQGASNPPTSDDQFQFVAGLDRSVTKHFDARLEYAYEEYKGSFSEYEPKLFSAGVVYHIGAK